MNSDVQLADNLAAGGEQGMLEPLRLLTTPDIVEGRRTPGWLGDSHRLFMEQLLDPRYPCYFGTAAERAGDIRYTYVEGRDWGHMPASLSAFLTVANAAPERYHILATFFRPEPRKGSHGDYEETFWALLQYLHDHDSSAWPGPTDPAHHLWTFAFAGVQMFTFFAAPSYEKRRSRHLGPGLIVMFQPRNVFGGIEGDTAAGRQARKAVRKKLAAWDAVPPHPQLGAFGDPSSLEWMQFVIRDDNGPIEGECPFRVRRP